MSSAPNSYCTTTSTTFHLTLHEMGLYIFIDDCIFIVYAIIYILFVLKCVLKCVKMKWWLDLSNNSTVITVTERSENDFSKFYLVIMLVASIQLLLSIRQS